MIKRDAQFDPETFDTVLAPALEENPQAQQFENTLRPKILDEYIGQQAIKKNLQISMDASKSRNEPLEHVLLYGPPGLGKTTLANILAKEMGVNIKITSGPALEKQGDLASILTNMKDFEVLFIDEIHRLKPAIEEVLYTAMEDYCLDLMIGKGPSARSMRLSLPRFTLIGATTKLNMLSSPLRSRFGHIFKFELYSTEDIQDILYRSSKILECELTDEAAEILARSSRQTPRIANRLLRRVRDFAAHKQASVITAEIAHETLKALGVDQLGLDRVDIELLKIIIEKFEGGPVGLNTLSAALFEEQETIEDIYEPYLLQLGFLERTSRGRIATKHAYEHLGITFISTSSLL
ncbi:MAG: Holliday junction branch migration DNA helicase RuvB [Candidatus Gracilibacteria bacterium]